MQDLKSQMEIDKNLRKDLEFQFKMQLNDKDDLINSLKAKLDSSSSVATTEKLIDIDTSSTTATNQLQHSPISETNNETKEKVCLIFKFIIRHYECHSRTDQLVTNLF